MSEFASPPLRILVRERNGMAVYHGPPSVTPEGGLPAPAACVSVDTSNALSAIPLPPRLAPVFSPDGSVVCLVRSEGQPIHLYRTDSGASVAEIPCLDALLVYFSPRGSFLVTYSRPTKGREDGTIEGNLRIWDASSGTLLSTHASKPQKRDSLQWTSDEGLCCKLVTNEVQVFPGRLEGDAAMLGRVRHPGATQFRLCPAPSATGCTVGIFQAEASGNPARAALYYFNASDGTSAPGPSRTMFSASECHMLWNLPGSALLVHTHSDVDKSNTSYYGATGLFVLTTSALGELTDKVAQSKEGPIHDVQWSPSGDRFILAAGSMPAQCTMYDSRAQVVYEFGAAHRNTVSWSPHGRFLCLAGFGNLAGEMDFYDMTKLKKIGSNTAHCSVSYGWSPDSRYFLTATLAPRMNVDNGYKIWKYNGIGPVALVSLEQALDAAFVPLPAALYPSRGQSPRRGGGDGEGGAANANPLPAPAAKAGVYRPPGSTGALAAMLSRDKAPVGKVKPGAASAGGGSSSSSSSSSGSSGGGGPGDINVLPGQRFPGDGQMRQRVIPGMSPEQAAADKAEADKAARRKADKERQRAKEEDKKREVALKEAAEKEEKEKAAARGPPRPEDLSPVEKDKRAKAIRKKLKLIEELRGKPAAELNADQVEKVAAEAALVAELALLGV